MFFFLFLRCFGGGRVTESHQRRPTISGSPQFFIAVTTFFFLIVFFNLSGDSFCSHGLARSPSLMQGGGGGVRGFAGGREGGVGARIAEPRAR